MSGGEVREDGSALSRWDRRVFQVESALNLVAGIVIFLLMCLAVTQILGRKLFNAPVPGFIDWVEQAMVVFAFLGVAYCQRLGGHIRMDLVIGRLKGRALWAAEMLGTALMLSLTVALTIGAYFHFLRSFDLDAPLFSRDSTIDISLPICVPSTP